VTDGAGAEGRVQHWGVAIHRAGAGGLGLAIRLAKSRRRDFVLFEASDGGGAAHGAATPTRERLATVPSHLYSYSFALKPDWSKTYPTSPRILRYFEDCADRFGISGHVRPHTRITSGALARKDQALAPDRRGKGAATRPMCSSAPSGRSPTPSLPDIPGSTRFAGPCFHSAALGSTSTTCQAAGGRRRDGGQRGADHPRTGQGCAVGPRVPAHTAVDPARSDKPFTEERSDGFARNRIAMRRHRKEIYWPMRTRSRSAGERRGPSRSRRLRAATSTTG